MELGLQSVKDETAALINRGHSYADFLDGYGAPVGLDQAGKDAGQQHQNKADREDRISLFSLCHLDFPSVS